MSSNKREIKREKILNGAENVFRKKGFFAVTMQDIVDECTISRGGLYLYFSSVDEIFVEVIRKYHKEKRERMLQQENINFDDLIATFFDDLKSSLLSMNNSLKTAMYEFYLVKKEEKKEFLKTAFYELKQPIYDILKTGSKKNIISENVVNELAEMIMLWCEGLEALAISTNLAESIIDNRLDFMKNLIYGYGFEN